MLRCSKCGTINADGQNFCNNCGSKLDRTEILCPNCGTLNSIGNIFCSKCHSKLISPDSVVPPEKSDTPITPVKGISLPTRASTDEESALPDWLQQLTDDVQEESLDEAPEDSSLTSTTDANVESELPDWLSELAEKDSRYAIDNEDEKDISGDASPSAQDLPEWLTVEPGDRELPEVDSDSPSIYTPEPTELDQEKVEGLQTEDTPSTELPGWLSDISDEMDAAVSTPVSGSGVPDWLINMAEDAEATPITQNDQPAPEWLTPSVEPKSDKSLTKDIEQTDTPAVESESESDTDPLTRVAGEEEEEETKSLIGKYQRGSQNGDLEIEGSPNKELQLPDRTFSIDQSGEAIDLTPDWLSIPVTDTAVEDNQGDQVHDQVDKKETPVIAEIPEWLNTLGESSDEADQTSTPKLSTQTVAANQNLPSWLSELEVPQDVPEDPQSVFTSESTKALDEIQESDTPAWLDEVSPIPEIIAMKPIAPAFISSGEDLDSQLDTDESEQDTAEDDEFPSWLNDLRFPDPDSNTDETTLNFGIASPEDGFPGAVNASDTTGLDDLVRAEVPEWMHDLMPPAEGSWSPLTTSPAQESLGIDDLTLADVPDWVQELRPQPGIQKEKQQEGFLPLEPAEVEGPLATLAGILPSTTIVDMPVDYEVNLVKIPDNVLKQAQLWQQLLGKPRSTARKVVQPVTRSNRNSTVLRIIVATILILGSLAALWLLPPGYMGITPSIKDTPGPQIIFDSVEALQPGETAIVAVEFGWTQAEEMTAIADAVLNHLMDRKINIIAVSTMPEGASIIPDLLDRNELSNALAGNSTYLTGSASGVAGFLKEPESQSASMLIVISSQYERLRWWIEQNQVTSGTTGDSALILNTGLSAAIGPLASPYLNEHNIEGWMVGFQDSLNYQALRGLQSAAQTRMLDILYFMHWLTIIFLIMGFLYTLVSGKKRIA